MGNNIDLGAWGEERALEYLISKDYVLLERNWRYSRAEIDLIVRSESELIFVEVKTRTAPRYLPPSYSITRRKQQLMLDVAAVFMERIGYEAAIRFDVVHILRYSDDHFKLEHFPDAFFPSW